MLASPPAARRTKLGRTVLASLVAACLLVACSGKDEEPVTADKLRSDLAQRVAERGAAGVSGVGVGSKGTASATLQIGDTYTTFGSVAGKGNEQTEDRFMFGHKAADQLPLQQVIDAATTTVSSCEALGETRGTGAAELVVAPQGQVIISRICTPSAADVVVGQSLDGKDLPELGQVDEQKTIAQVLGEYKAKEGARAIHAVGIDTDEIVMQAIKDGVIDDPRTCRFDPAARDDLCPVAR